MGAAASMQLVYKDALLWFRQVKQLFLFDFSLVFLFYLNPFSISLPNHTLMILIQSIKITMEVLNFTPF